MAPKNDPRREVGQVVKTLAKHATHDRHCSNRFGVEWAKKEVYGWVRDVEKVVGINKKGATMATTYITGTFIIVPGVVKTVKTHIVNIKPVEIEDRQQFLAWADWTLIWMPLNWIRYLNNNNNHHQHNNNNHQHHPQTTIKQTLAHQLALIMM